ncbi:MAG: hypothetical protein EOP24_28915 [Hyphomicrobiales bacterium]|nr:MAG: hypothetical protein EOP24_28915 [Hyphomicrobiales bacterium]
MRGFTEFAGRLTRLAFCKERGVFVAEVVPHAFVARGALPKPSPNDGPAAETLQLHAVPCPCKGEAK